MSQFSGKQFEGAMRQRQTEKRSEAEARNLLTKPERRRDPGRRLLAQIFTEPEAIVETSTI